MTGDLGRDRRTCPTSSTGSQWEARLPAHLAAYPTVHALCTGQVTPQDGFRQPSTRGSLDVKEVPGTLRDTHILILRE